MATYKAIAHCRVSTVDQAVEGHSLEAQEKYVYECANYLDAEIIKIWSLNISSKKGMNLNRKDLKEIYQFCKDHPEIKYYILDVPDRFMRGFDEYFWWKVELKKIGVLLAFAQRPDLTHCDDPQKIMWEMFEVFKGEASNYERMTKTTRGMNARAAAGYWPSNPKQGYRAGSVPALHVPDHRMDRFKLLQKALKSVANFKMTPDEARIWLKENGYQTPKGYELDMNHWQGILLDPYYAGIIKFGNCPINENGLHEAMITKQEWETNVAIISKRNIKRRGQFNPDYPLNKYIHHRGCDLRKASTNKFSGFNHGNGKTWSRPDYGCRGCYICLPRDDIHDNLSSVLGAMRFIEGSKAKLEKSLKTAWADEEQYRIERLRQLNKLKAGQEEVKSRYVESLVRNPELADDIKEELAKVKAQIAEYEAQIAEASQVDKEFQNFTFFALDFVENLRLHFWELDQESFITCLKLLFPENIGVESDTKLHISKISPFYTLEPDTESSEMAENMAENGEMVIPRGIEPLLPG